MEILSVVLVAFVALLHFWFMILEIFLWTRPAGRRAFGLTQEFADQTRAMAANQGLYNGFLVAGLVWGLLLGAEGFPQLVFFLSCVIVAGVFGGATVNKRIVLVQAVPALVALIAVYLARA